jgi:hypothetical protein
MLNVVQVTPTKEQKVKKRKITKDVKNDELVLKFIWSGIAS